MKLQDEFVGIYINCTKSRDKRPYIVPDILYLEETHIRLKSPNQRLCFQIGR